MRIAFLTIAMSGNGGVASYFSNLINQLKRKGHELLIIHDDPNAVFAVDGVSAIYIPRVSRYDVPGEGQPLKDALEALKTFKPDLVHVQDCNNFKLEALIRGAYPALKTLHVFDFCPSGNKYHHATHKVCNLATGRACIANMIFRRCMLSKNPLVLHEHYRRAVEANRHNSGYKKIIVASDYVRQAAVQSGYLREQIEVIPYFTEFPRPRDAEWEPLLLVAGRLTKEKGMDLFLEALAKIRSSAHAVIAGDGKELAFLKKKADELGLLEKIKFAGWLSPDAMAELYQKMTALVIPSVWPEPFGIVGIEAMAHAKPVVGFRVGGIPEWLKEGENGFLIEPYDTAAMASALDRLLENKVLGQRMGRAGLLNAERDYSFDAHYGKIMRVYEMVMKRGVI